MTAPGKLIAIEGLDGAGKSTALAVVLDILANHHQEVITTREPGGTPQGEIIRNLLKDPDYKNSMDPRTELLLMYASRIQLIKEVIKPALQRGCWVVTDRFELSSFAYQGGGREIDESIMRTISQFSLEGFQPDLTIFMDIEPEAGIQRAGARGEHDRFEKESMAFFNRTHAAYHHYLKDQKNAVLINAAQPLEQVLVNLHTVITRFINTNKPI